MRLLSPKMISERWTFDLGGQAHPASWGEHGATISCSKGARWTAKDFVIHEKLGAGCFGIVVHAEYMQPGPETENTANLDHGQSVALKVFLKSKLLTRQLEGKKSILLLQREISIQSQYV